MSYTIIQKLSERPGKVSLTVSFNGKPGEFYEVESNDPTEIDAILTKVANEAACITPAQDILAVKAGKIAYKAGMAPKVEEVISEG